MIQPPTDMLLELAEWNNGDGIYLESWIGCSGDFRLAVGYSTRRIAASITLKVQEPKKAPSVSLHVEHSNVPLIMKLLFSTPDSAKIGLFRSRLEAAGIECEMRNEHLSPAMPGAPFQPELWVLRDEQFDEARKLLAEWCQSTSSEEKEY